MQFFEQYSITIPDAIPSVTLALSELEYRDKFFASPNQKLHRQLIETVVGTEYLFIFEANDDSDRQQMLPNTVISKG